MGLLEGRVILITGAGQGLGRAYALACAREGARIVVNDLGGSRDGSGTDASAAERVVAEIAALGGEAVANRHSVTDPEGCRQLVGLAMARWGRLDGLVNNAGILRDRSFARMTEDEWRVVLDVHLNGTWHVTKAALPALLDTAAAHGRAAIVNTTSYSGLIGNFGQANYGAAKGGIYALTRVLAVELRKKGVQVNALAPIAKTRMTDELAHIEASWTPDHVAPVVVYLLSDLARDVSGRVFGVQGQRIHAYEMKTNDGVEKPGDVPWTAEEISQNLDAIFSFAPAGAPDGTDEVSQAMARLPAALRADRAAGWKATLHFVVRGGVDQTLVVVDQVATVRPGLHGSPTCTVKSSRETLLAALSGELDLALAVEDGKLRGDNKDDLARFVEAFAASGGPWVPPIGKLYHGGYALVERAQAEAYAAATNDDSDAYWGPDAIAPPMFHVRILRDMLFAVMLDPELGLDFLRLVHGECDAIFHKPLRPGDLVQLRARLDDVEQKAKGLLVRGTLLGFTDGELAVESRSSFFVRGQMKLPVPEAAPREKEAAVELPPPEFTVSWQVDPDQSYRYREASLDDNPIHVDPEVARKAGLPDVILHGLCTMAMSGASLLRRLAFNDARKLRRLSVRFSKPVHNGSKLETRAWHTERGVEFIVSNSDGEPVITNGLAVIEE